MPLIQADVFAVLLMNDHKKLTNIVIGKSGKLLHKQNFTSDFFLILLIIASLLYKLDTLLLKQNNLPVFDITGFFFRILTQVMGLASSFVSTLLYLMHIVYLDER